MQPIRIRKSRNKPALAASLKKNALTVNPQRNNAIPRRAVMLTSSEIREIPSTSADPFFTYSCISL
jgi:hypothetical protein